MTEAIRNAQPGETIYDRGEESSVPGLHLRVGPKGNKRFFLFYVTRKGTRRRPKLGEFPLLSVNDARKIAKAILLKVAAGEDPGAQWEEARAERTVDELFEATWRDHWSKPRYKDSGWAREAQRNYKLHIKPTFGALRISEVTASSVLNWHASLEATPYAANRSLECFSRMFTYAIEQEWKPLPECEGANPCRLVKAHPERKRKRFASKEEIEKLGQILEREKEKHPRQVAFIYLLMLSGSRPSFIAKATREDLTLQGDVGFLRLRGKMSDTTGEDEVVVLPPKALALINALPPSPTLTGLKNPSVFWGKVRKEAGCPDLWARDWRRTFATVGMAEGIDMDLIGKMLNHKSKQTTDLYAQLPLTTQANTAKKIAERFEEIISSAAGILKNTA